MVRFLVYVVKNSEWFFFLLFMFIGNLWNGFDGRVILYIVEKNGC